MVAAILFSLPFVVVPPASVPSPTTDCQLEVLSPQALEERTLAEFAAVTGRYVQLHRRLERSLPPEHLFANPEDMVDAREALAAALRDARPLARRGSIFTPGVANLFRDRIDEAVRLHAVDLRTAIDDEGEPWVPEPEIHAALPWRLPADIWPPLHRWPALLHALPPLPAELEYRFANRSLLLIDVHANIVVDVLDDVLPEW